MATCLLYADLTRLDGSPLVGARVQVQNLFSPGTLGVVESHKEYTTNSSGHVEFRVVRGVRIRVAFPGSPLTRDVTVPEEDTANLLTLLGQATDNFAVVA